MSDSPLTARFWGVRGSIPTPHTEFLQYGGNTACLELRYEDQPPVILDGGSGLRRLGLSLQKEFAGRSLEAHVLLTHFHWDHIQGIPFLSPLYSSGVNLTFHSVLPGPSLRKLLRGQMAEPYFPVALPAVQASVEYHQVKRDGLRFGDLHIHPIPLRHPGGSSGFRITTPRGVMVYATDHEHGDQQHDDSLSREVEGADVLIYDSQFAPQEYPSRVGWGHSTWLEGVNLARRAGVGRLVLFHHDPQRDDASLSKLVCHANEELPGTVAAREGDCLQL